MSKKNDATGDLKESEDGNVEFGTPTDDEDVTIPSQDRNREVPEDFRTLMLLPTEPLHGARPRQTGRERPPVIDNRPPIDATGGAVVRKPGRTLLLSPGRRILMEEEVITPPRGGHPAPEPPEDSLRDGGLRQNNIGSPLDIHVDTVSRIQKDMA